MFKNMDECHFLEVYHDLSSYCSAEVVEEEEQDDEWAKYDFDTTLEVPDRCTFASLTQNMKANVFSLVTKGSAIGASFQQEGFEDQSAEEKAYAYQQLGHTLGSIFADLSGFEPTNLIY